MGSARLGDGELDQFRRVITAGNQDSRIPHAVFRLI